MQLHHGDCLEILPTLPDKSIDAVICDPPYGTTACKWDSPIPFEPMWRELKRLIKPRGAIVLFGSQPFTSALVMSNPGWFKYEWVWVRDNTTGFLNVSYRPLQKTEQILVFSGANAGGGARSNQMKYNPQGVTRIDRMVSNNRNSGLETLNTTPRNIISSGKPYLQKYSGYPNNTLTIGRDRPQVHPTQKPVALLEYLIRTYTDEGDTVLDFTMGSGTTGVACVNTGREFVGIEKERSYFEIAERRIREAADPLHHMKEAS